MTVAFSATQSSYTDGMLAQLQKAVPEHNFVQMHEGSDAQTAADAEVMLAMGAATRETMQKLPRLALVQTLSDGYETVDIDAASDLGIWVSYSPADATGNADSVAEYAILLLLATARQLGTARASIHDPAVKKPGNGRSLLGKTVCLVGLGSIGDKIAQRLSTFGVRLIGVDRQPLQAPKQVPTRPLENLNDALGEADFVVLGIRATAQNKHMFDAAALRAMKKDSVLVNIARGSLVDEAALYDAVKSGNLAGAGLDVLEKEPVDPADPLLTLPSVFVTPHEAGLTDLTVQGTVAYIKQVLQSFEAGKKPKSLLNEPASPRKPLKAS